MTREGWRELILDTFVKYSAGDSGALELLTDLLAEQDEAKHRLRVKGYGCIGMPWLRTIEEVPRRAD